MESERVNGANNTRRTNAYRNSLDASQRLKDIKSIKNPTARKNQLRNMAEQAYYKNVKRPIKKAAKSISSKAQAAWNNSASYREQFADYKSFLNWYKKNRK